MTNWAEQCKHNEHSTDDMMTWFKHESDRRQEHCSLTRRAFAVWNPLNKINYVDQTIIN